MASRPYFIPSVENKQRCVLGFGQLLKNVRTMVPIDDCNYAAKGRKACYHPKELLSRLTSTRLAPSSARMGKVLSGFELPPNARRAKAISHRVRMTP